MARYSNESQTQLLTAQNAVFGPVRARLGRNAGSVTLMSGPDNHSSCALVLQGSYKQAGVYYDIDLIDPDDAGGAVIEGITGASKAGVAPLNANSFEWFQVKRTDANGGAAIAYLMIQ